MSDATEVRVELERPAGALEVTVSAIAAIVIAVVPPALVLGLAGFGPDPVGRAGSVVVTVLPAAAWLGWHRWVGHRAHDRTVSATAVATSAWIVLTVWEHRPGTLSPLWTGGLVLAGLGILAIATVAMRSRGSG